jgi:hypothetical protein
MMCVAALGAQSTASGSGDDTDHAVVYEIGWAGDWSRKEGLHAKGGSFAFEVTPFERWLEVEVGVTAIRADGSTEIPVDVLFKKPWTISRQVELMIGAGPELIHATDSEHGTFWGFSSVVDLMFWPTRNVGWYLEPGYEMTFPHGPAHHGLGMAAGLLVGR